MGRADPARLRKRGAVSRAGRGKRNSAQGAGRLSTGEQRVCIFRPVSAELGVLNTFFFCEI